MNEHNNPNISKTNREYSAFNRNESLGVVVFNRCNHRFYFSQMGRKKEGKEMKRKIKIFDIILLFFCLSMVMVFLLTISSVFHSLNLREERQNFCESKGYDTFGETYEGWIECYRKAVTETEIIDVCRTFKMED